MEEKTDEVSKAELFNIWTWVLMFLGDQWYGKEFFERFQKYHVEMDPVKEGDIVLSGVELEDYEKRLFDFVSLGVAYLRENGHLIPSGRLQFTINIANAMTQVFWAMVRQKRPDIQQMSLSVRDGYVLVSRAKEKSRESKVEQLIRRSLLVPLQEDEEE